MNYVSLFCLFLYIFFLSCFLSFFSCFLSFVSVSHTFFLSLCISCFLSFSLSSLPSFFLSVFLSFTRCFHILRVRCIMYSSTIPLCAPNVIHISFHLSTTSKHIHGCMHKQMPMYQIAYSHTFIYVHALTS